MEKIGQKPKTNKIIFPLFLIRGIEFWITQLSGWYWLEKEEQWVEIKYKDIATYFVMSLGLPTYLIKRLVWHVSAKKFYRPKNWRPTRRYVRFNLLPQHKWILRVKWELWYAQETRAREAKVREMLYTLQQIPQVKELKDQRKLIRRSGKNIQKAFGIAEEKRKW